MKFTVHVFSDRSMIVVTDRALADDEAARLSRLFEEWRSGRALVLPEGSTVIFHPEPIAAAKA